MSSWEDVFVPAAMFGHCDTARPSDTTAPNHPDTAHPSDTTAPNHPPTPSGPMTRARARAMQQKVNSLLSTLDLGTYLDGMLFTSDTLCVIRYIPQEHPDETQPRQEEEEEKTVQSRRGEEEGMLDERYYRPDYSGTTAPSSGTTAPASSGTTAPTTSPQRLGGTTADQEARYYRSSGTTAQEQAVLPAARSPSRSLREKFRKST